MRFRDIQSYIQQGSYEIVVPLRFFKKQFDEYFDDDGLEINPDFQRNHVWTKFQQIKFIEHVLRKGQINPIYLNHECWSSGRDGWFVVVDGKQRITAIYEFLNNKIPAFGVLYNDYKDKCDIMTGIKVNINELKTRKEVLQWYLDLNDGGVVHTQDELNKVRMLLNEENKDD